MNYLELTVRSSREASEAVANLLTEIAGGGVAIDDPLAIQRGKERGDWDYCDLLPGDREYITIKAYLARTGDLEEKLRRIQEGLRVIAEVGLGRAEVVGRADVAEEDWDTAWKAYFKPSKVGRKIVIVPSWEEYDPAPGEIIIRLDPGMAFGTGTHPTTALCLRALEDHLTPGSQVVDIGTGSGVLAIAAAKLGAPAVYALDTDAVAVEAGRENVALNGVAAAVTPAQGELKDLPPGFLKDCSPGLGAPGLIVANIIADVIIALASQAARILPPGGVFIAGGIIGEREAEVARALEGAGFDVAEARREGGWSALVSRRAERQMFAAGEG